jgi:hypothetical protein
MVVLSILGLSLSGARRLIAQYGSALVRERNALLPRNRCKAVELIEAEQPWEPRARHSTPSVSGRPYRERTKVLVHTSFLEHDRRARIKRVWSRWLPDLKLWAIACRYTIAIGLREHIICPRDSK